MTNGSKKKILIFIPEFPRLTETFIEREVSKLIDFGNLDITVFSLKRASGETSEEVSNRTVYKRLDICSCLLAALYFSFGKFLRLVKAFNLILGKDRVSIFRRFIHFLKGVAYAWLFKKYNPDHIHAHFLSEPSTIAMVAAEILGIPFSVSGHARDVMTDGTLIPSKVKKAKFISICNKHAYRSCIDQAGGMDTSNVYQQYHGVPADRIMSGTPKIPKPGRPFVFIVARLVEKKGLPYAIEASKILKDRGINHELHIVGPGPLYQQLNDLIKEKSLKDLVFIHGEGEGLSWEEVLEYYKIADIFVLPSIETESRNADGVPNTVVEAAFAKIPVVTTDAGSITDLIVNEETGILVPQRDPVRLADGIERLIFDENLRKRMQEEAFNKAKEMFDLDKNVQEIENLLLE